MTDKQAILITGATGNISDGAARALARRDAKVVLLGRKIETLKARANLIRTAYPPERLLALCLGWMNTSSSAKEMAVLTISN